MATPPAATPAPEQPEIVDGPEPVAPLEPAAGTGTVSIREWLDQSVKAGYGAKFASAFEELGICSICR